MAHLPGDGGGDDLRCSTRRNGVSPYQPSPRIYRQLSGDNLCHRENDAPQADHRLKADKNVRAKASRSPMVLALKPNGSANKDAKQHASNRNPLPIFHDVCAPVNANSLCSNAWPTSLEVGEAMISAVQFPSTSPDFVCHRHPANDCRNLVETPPGSSPLFMTQSRFPLGFVSLFSLIAGIPDAN